MILIITAGITFLIDVNLWIMMTTYQSYPTPSNLSSNQHKSVWHEYVNVDILHILVLQCYYMGVTFSNDDYPRTISDASFSPLCELIQICTTQKCLVDNMAILYIHIFIFLYCCIIVRVAHFRLINTHELNPTPCFHLCANQHRCVYV